MQRASLDSLSAELVNNSTFPNFYSLKWLCFQIIIDSKFLTSTPCSLSKKFALNYELNCRNGLCIMVIESTSENPTYLPGH